MGYMREVEPRMGVRDLGTPMTLSLGMKGFWPIPGVGPKDFTQLSKGHGHLDTVAWA